MKPNDVSQEAWDAGQHAMNSVGYYSPSDFAEMVARLIMAAKAEEREACARIAQDYDGLGREPSEGAAYGDASLTQMDIAESIRSRT